MKNSIYGWMCFILVACGQNTDTTKKDSITVALSTAPITKDPTKATDTTTLRVLTQIFDTFIEKDANGTLLPGLATSWKAISPTQWEFKLREGVNFHNGSPFTSADAVATVKRLSVTTESQSLFNKITNVTASDDYTINIYLKSPFAPLIGYFSHGKSAVMNKDQIADYDKGIISDPIGTGPYKYSEWVQGDYTKLTSNPEYWGVVPAINTLTFKTIVDPSIKSIALETGEVQIVMDVAYADIDFLKNKEGVTLIQTDGTGVAYLGFNVKNPKLQSLKLREAITLAIDKQGIINAVLNGQGTVADTMFGKTMVGYLDEPDPLSYNPEKAKQIIQDEGLTNISLKLAVNEGVRAKMAEIIQANLQTVGIEIEIEVLEWGTLLELMDKGKQDLFILGWGNVSQDPDDTLYSLYHSDNFGAGNNVTFYKNDTVNSYLEQGKTIFDLDKRTEIYRKAQRILRAERPFVPLHFIIDPIATADNVKGITLKTSGAHRLNTVTYSE